MKPERRNTYRSAGDDTYDVKYAVALLESSTKGWILENRMGLRRPRVRKVHPQWFQGWEYVQRHESVHGECRIRVLNSRVA